MGTYGNSQASRVRRAASSSPPQRALITPNPKLKLLDQVREVLRLKHYSLSTERSYYDWIRRYIQFHHMKSRQDMNDGEAKIELFLNDLAVNGHVAVSTQNLAFNALLFVYREVLHQIFDWKTGKAMSAGNSLVPFLSVVYNSPTFPPNFRFVVEKTAIFVPAVPGLPGVLDTPASTSP